jgi:hypothetical protein
MKKLLGFVLVLTIPLTLSFCPSPLTHHHFALLFLRYASLNEEQRRAFLVGTQFPDIRFIAGGELLKNRLLTHPAVNSLNEITGQQSPYIAGKLLHSYVDDKRVYGDDMNGSPAYDDKRVAGVDYNPAVVDEKFGDGKWRIMAEKYNIMVSGRVNPPSKKGVLWEFDAFLKFVEEEVLAHQYDTAAVGLLYKNIYQEVDQDTYKKEFACDVTQGKVDEWHERVVKFVTTTPNNWLNKEPEIFKGTPLEQLKNWGKAIGPVSADPVAQDYVDRFVAVFDSAFSMRLLKNIPASNSSSSSSAGAVSYKPIFSF